MVELVPIFQNQYTVPLIISLAIVADLVAQRLNRNQSPKGFYIQLLFLMSVAIIQGGLFKAFKQNNLYQDLKFTRQESYTGNTESLIAAQDKNDTSRAHFIEQYQIIVSNPERLTFYEKYHEITTDLHTLRNPSFQNEHIMTALNFYLVTLMIAIQVTNDKNAQHSRNYIISLIFSLYVMEAHLILSKDIKINDYQFLSTVTQKELILFVKTQLLIMIMMIKLIIIHFLRPMHEKVEVSLKQTEQDYFKYSKKQDDTDISVVLKQIRVLVDKINNGSEESSDGFSSNKTLYQVLSIMTIFMLLTGNYEE